jgi:hypothetical protein
VNWSASVELAVAFAKKAMLRSICNRKALRSGGMTWVVRMVARVWPSLEAAEQEGGNSGRKKVCSGNQQRTGVAAGEGRLCSYLASVASLGCSCEDERGNTPCDGPSVQEHKKAARTSTSKCLESQQR